MPRTHDGYIEVQEYAAAGDPHWAEDDGPIDADPEETEIDLGGDDDLGYSGCEDPRLKPGAIVTSAALESRDGQLVATAVNVATS